MEEDDSRRVLVASGNGLALVDSSTGQRSAVTAPEGPIYRLGGAGRPLMVEREVHDADVWLLEAGR